MVRGATYCSLEKYLIHAVATLLAIITVSGDPIPDNSQAQAVLNTPTSLPEVGSLSYGVKTWTVHDGLPHSQVSCVVRARSGSMWIGTLGALVFFDGVRMRALADR